MNTNKLKVIGTDVAITGIAVTFGAAHLIFQSLADVTVKTEAKMLNKVIGKDNKGDDIFSVHTLIKSRLKTTRETQRRVKQVANKPFKELPKKYQEMVNSLKSKVEDAEPAV